MITYEYQIEGSGAGGQTWSTAGSIEVTGRGDFMNAVTEAMRGSFVLLTDGKAIYGHPGVGCSGPYSITKLIISESKRDEA